MGSTRGLRFSVNPVAYRSVLGYFFLIISGVLAISAVVLALSALVFARNALETEGSVVDFQEVENAAPFLAAAPEDAILYYPIIAYVRHDGRTERFVASFGGYRHNLQLGDTVAVLYTASSRSRASIAHWWYVWGRTLIVGGLSLLFGLVSAVMPYAFGTSQRQRAAPPPLQ